MVKALVVYDSLYGNTEKIARALEKGLGDGGLAVDCVRVDTIELQKLSSYDLLVFGGPTHSMGASKPMQAFLERLKGKEGPLEEGAEETSKQIGVELAKMM